MQGAARPKTAKRSRRMGPPERRATSAPSWLTFRPATVCPLDTSRQSDLKFTADPTYIDFFRRKRCDMSRYETPIFASHFDISNRPSTKVLTLLLAPTPPRMQWRRRASPKKVSDGAHGTTEEEDGIVAPDGGMDFTEEEMRTLHLRGGAPQPCYVTKRTHSKPTTPSARCTDGWGYDDHTHGTTSTPAPELTAAPFITAVGHSNYCDPQEPSKSASDSASSHSTADELTKRVSTRPPVAPKSVAAPEANEFTLPQGPFAIRSASVVQRAVRRFIAVRWAQRALAFNHLVKVIGSDEVRERRSLLKQYHFPFLVLEYEYLLDVENTARRLASENLRANEEARRAAAAAAAPTKKKVSWEEQEKRRAEAVKLCMMRKSFLSHHEMLDLVAMEPEDPLDKELRLPDVLGPLYHPYLLDEAQSVVPPPLSYYPGNVTESDVKAAEALEKEGVDFKLREAPALPDGTTFVPHPAAAMQQPVVEDLPFVPPELARQLQEFGIQMDAEDRQEREEKEKIEERLRTLHQRVYASPPEREDTFVAAKWGAWDGEHSAEEVTAMETVDKAFLLRPGSATTKMCVVCELDGVGTIRCGCGNHFHEECGFEGTGAVKFACCRVCLRK